VITKDREKQKHFMQETAAFFEKLEKHQYKPKKSNTTKHSYYRGANR
jgi:hypothetical protein